ncbi:hypothetical protein HH303_15885 [Rhodospirillaceae bacterium KN72]|uniref:Pentapeptide repeat-containing protein n=1 Tax=Pacificispira spongiicola TaxID=2729598 RepID=A0A7Y0E2I1_9PROT|nr:pentapeptide repeat-containing protein [Pacificispira spongiicola]NMM45978.1 hypothetical protein [Pacificispira spongiicola]
MTDAPPKRIPANENPWYRLATVHGEQPVDGVFNNKLAAKNRLVWNRWMAQSLSESSRFYLLQKGSLSSDEVGPLTDSDREAISTRLMELKAPDPNTEINWSETEFPNNSLFNGYLFCQSVHAKNALFNGYTSFSLAIFRDAAVFSESLFMGNTSFYAAIFFGYSTFHSASFRKPTSFNEAYFQGLSVFREAAFLDTSGFNQALFFEDVDFRETSFHSYTDFRMTKCLGDEAIFYRSVFKGYTIFRDATFGGYADCYADFREAAFLRDANFEGVAFNGKAIFCGAPKAVSETDNMSGSTITGSRAQFSDPFEARFEERVSSSAGISTSARRECAGETSFVDVHFRSVADFTNRVFLAKTAFDGCKFETLVPVFAGADLHQRTTWRGVSWPRTPNSPKAAGEMADAYAHLRLRMNAIQNHEKELEFFARELRAKQVELGFWQSIPIRIYAVLSDYGQGLRRPALWLVALWYLCAVIYRGGSGDAVGPLQALGFSAASLGGLFGMRREFFGTFLTDFPVPWFGLMSGIQSVLGAVFVFLIGLALRNRFRIR